MRQRNMANRFNLFYSKYPMIGLPLLVSIQLRKTPPNDSLKSERGVPDC
jgi:hypothetical protein